MLERQNIYRKSEIENRYHTKLEQYITALEIEKQTLCDLVNTRVVPAVFEYQSRLVQVIKGLRDLNGLMDDMPFDEQTDILKEVTRLLRQLRQRCSELEVKSQKAAAITSLPEQAKFYADHITKAMDAVREPADRLEQLLPDELWPLPKYSEMLFIM